MCIAIYKPAHETLSDEVLARCYETNSDGCGFAYINEDNNGVKRIKIKKTMSFEVFLRQYKRAVMVNPESPFLVHFRIATHGTVNKFNCHPFSIENDTVFIHNGVIRDVERDKIKSDTQMFNEEILKGIHPEDLIYNDTIKRLLEEFIGFGSKLVFMNVEGDIQICNEAKGNWDGDIWFSNLSWKPKPKPKPTTYTYPTVYNRDLTLKMKSIHSFEQCDICGTLEQISAMNAYRCAGDMVIFCPGCTEKGMEQYSIMPFDSVRPFHFVAHVNSTALIESVS